MSNDKTKVIDISTYLKCAIQFGTNYIHLFCVQWIDNWGGKVHHYNKKLFFKNINIF